MKINKTRVFIDFGSYIEPRFRGESFERIEIQGISIIPRVGDIFDGVTFMIYVDNSYEMEWIDESSEIMGKMIVYEINHTFSSGEHHIIITLIYEKQLEKAED